MEPRERRFLVANSVKSEIARQRWTEQRLAVEVQMPMSVLLRKLAGQLPITIDELDAIAEALGVAVDSLLGSE